MDPQGKTSLQLASQNAWGLGLGFRGFGVGMIWCLGLNEGFARGLARSPLNLCTLEAPEKPSRPGLCGVAEVSDPTDWIQSISV